MNSESHDCVQDESGGTSVATQTRIRSLVRQHYYRNRHLTSVHDDDDLFQDAWIQFHSSERSVSDDQESTDTDQQPGDQRSQHDLRLRRAVRQASGRAFGKLRKRRSRGTATEMSLEFEPADCLPDFALVIDLRNQIESLPCDERMVIELMRCGFDGNEIAEQLEMSPQAVSRRKQKAISRLRRTLIEPDSNGHRRSGFKTHLSNPSPNVLPDRGVQP